MVLSFEIAGKPFGKQRPRVTRGGHAYTPKETGIYENLIKVAFQTAYPDHIPVSTGVRMDVKAVYPIPESWSKKKKKKAVAHLLHPNKPDWDNVGKIVSDALNQIAYTDDAQVYDAHVHKEYGLKPGLKVKIEIDEITEVDDGI